MSGSGWEQLVAIGIITAVCAPLLGRYLAATFGGGPKSPRPNTRVLDRRQFDFILTTADLLERMFGRAKSLKQ